jgi:L-rhamnonate dehydratase
MKITKVEAIEVRLPESETEYKASAAQDALIIRIHTEAGIVGIGEVDSSPWVAKAVVEAPMRHSIATGLGWLLIGMGKRDAVKRGTLLGF